MLALGLDDDSVDLLERIAARGCEAIDGIRVRLKGVSFALHVGCRLTVERHEQGAIVCRQELTDG